MNAKHTPGPWRAVPRSGALTGTDIQVGPYRVASVASTNPHADANARLIAEAPAMLEALREVDAAPHADGCRWWDANISELSTPEARAANDARCNCFRSYVSAILARIDGAAS